MTTPRRDPRLDAWLRLLLGESDPEHAAPATGTPRTAPGHAPDHAGFVKGSQAWHDAIAAGETPLEIAPDPAQSDLFTAPAPARFVLDETALMRPRGFTPEPPADAAGGATDIEHHTAIAWDATRVVLACARGLCTIARARWEAGARACDGC